VTSGWDVGSEAKELNGVKELRKRVRELEKALAQAAGLPLVALGETTPWALERVRWGK
jgi:hypothetical protein